MVTRKGLILNILDGYFARTRWRQKFCKMFFSRSNFQLSLCLHYLYKRLQEMENNVSENSPLKIPNELCYTGHHNLNFKVLPIHVSDMTVRKERGCVRREGRDRCGKSQPWPTVTSPPLAPSDQGLSRDRGKKTLFLILHQLN